MITNTFIICFFILSLALTVVDSRNFFEKQKDKNVKLDSKRLVKNSDRSKREFDPQTSPLNTVRSALQWRPNSQQPQGQVYK
uniref:Uncharacterized protein n=1 Tax=Caenorhabditis tropicalis TaxID=1561998 RepID=A0A1I7T397_9PELO